MILTWLNSFETLDLCNCMLSPDHITHQFPEIYSDSCQPWQVPAYEQYPFNNTYDDSYVFSNTKLMTPGRCSPLVYDNCFKTIANTVPHVSYCNGYVPHVQYDVMPGMPYPYVVDTPAMPYVNTNICMDAYQMPYVNGGLMSISPPMSYVSGTWPTAYQTCNNISSNCTFPGESQLCDMTSAFKNVNVVENPVAYLKEADIMLYVNNDHYYQNFVSADVTESKAAEESRYLSKMIENEEEKYVPEVVKSAIDDLRDLYEEEIIQPEVQVKTEMESCRPIERPNFPMLHSLDLSTPITGESSKLCEFYFTTPVDGLKQHLSNQWKLNQRCDCCGESPFHFAVRLDSVELINVLANKAKVDLRNKRGQTALHVACEINNVDMVDRLLDLHAYPLTKNLKEETCMFVCMRKGNVRVAETILRKTKADLSLDDPKDHLMAATRMGSKDFVELFLEFKADIDYVDKEGNSAVFLALKLGHEDVFDCLLKHRADITGTHTNEYNSLLHLACKQNREVIVKKLLCAGASVDAVNDRRLKPLHVAVQYSSLKIVDMLLSFGSDIEAKDALMRTPLHLAIQHNKPAIVKYLLGNGASTDTVVAPLIKALQNNELYTIKLVLSHGYNLDQQDEDGQTFLDAADAYESVDLMNFLCEVNTSRDLCKST